MAWGNWAVKVKRGNQTALLALLMSESDAEDERDRLNSIYQTDEYYVEEWRADG